MVGHTEPDHSGSLEKLLDLTPNATVVGSATAITFLKEIVNKPFASRAVKEGDTPETLQRRVMEQAEWVLLPQATELLSAELVKERE